MRPFPRYAIGCPLLVLAGLLAGCGGGGGSAPAATAAAPQGVALLQGRYFLNLHESFDGVPDYGRTTAGRITLDGDGGSLDPDLDGVFHGVGFEDAASPVQRCIVGDDGWLLAGAGSHWWDGFVTSDGRLALGTSMTEGSRPSLLVMQRQAESHAYGAVAGHWSMGWFRIAPDGRAQSGLISALRATDEPTVTASEVTHSDGGFADLRTYESGSLWSGTGGHVHSSAFPRYPLSGRLSADGNVLWSRTGSTSGATEFLVGLRHVSGQGWADIAGTWRLVGMGRSLSGTGFTAHRGTITFGAEDTATLDTDRNVGGAPVTVGAPVALALNYDEATGRFYSIDGGPSGAIHAAAGVGFLLSLDSRGGPPTIYVFAR